MKKIMAFVLSIAVLFAFAACEPGSTMSYYGKDVESITLLSVPNYIEGETLNPSDVSLRVVYNNGEEATRTGADLGLAPATESGSDFTINEKGNFVLAEGSNYFGIAYGSDRDYSTGNVTGEKTWFIDVEALAASAVDYTINPANAAKEIEKVASGEYTLTEDDLKGLAVTAEFADGTTKPVSADIADIKASTFAVKANGTTATVAVAEGNDNYKLSAEWTMTIVEKTVEITGIELVFDPEAQEIFAESTGENRVLLKDVDYTVVVSYSDDSEEPIAKGEEGDNGEVSVYFTDYDPDHTYVQDVSKTSPSFTAKVTYDGYTEPAAKLSVTYTKDYPKSFEATVKDAFDAKLMDGDDFKNSMFDFIYSNWASGAVYSDTAAVYKNILVENAKILDGEQAAGNGHSVYLYWADEDFRDKVNEGKALKVTVDLAELTTE